MPSQSLRIERARPLLGTVVRMRVDGLPPSRVHAAIDAAFREVAEIHRLMSFQTADSELSRLNREAWRTAVPVSAQTRAVLEAALDLAAASEGLFDPTVAPVLVRDHVIPAPDGPEPDGEATWRDICLTDRWVAFARPLWLDLSGIAKGYAVDSAVDCLRLHGAEKVCVEAGGDLRLFGPGAERVHLAAGGDHPAALDVEDAAIASSGSQSPPDGGSPVSPHVDPRTGRVCAPDRFVTVVAPRCIDADGLTKVVMAAGAAAEPVLARFGAWAFLFERAQWTAIGEAA
jgi:thiamine biosynthesis lipoprotein